MSFDEYIGEWIHELYNMLFQQFKGLEGLIFLHEWFCGHITGSAAFSLYKILPRFITVQHLDISYSIISTLQLLL